MDLPSFLARIDYQDGAAPTLQALRGIHRAFLLAVPFENLDIHLGRPIVLDEDRLFQKIVNQRRGGFCYELNGLLAAALREIGFDVTLLSAGVCDGAGDPGRDFAHLLLLIDLHGQRWIADVGFGEGFVEPICLDRLEEQNVNGIGYSIAAIEPNRYAMQHRPAGGEWKSRYSFSLEPRRLSEFAAMCDYFQFSPDSWFRQRRICTRQTPAGRITLTDRHLIVTTSGGVRKEFSIDNEDARSAALREHFGMEF